ncbi:MAG: hypothetical protein AB7D51_10560 [Desulfovibrionaceae bacterium]
MAFGLLCALFALALAGWRVMTQGEDDWLHELVRFGPLGGFAAGTLCWRWLVAGKERYGLLLGAAVGALTGILFYWFFFYFWILWGNVKYWILGMEIHPLGGPPMNPLLALVAAGPLGVWGIILYGSISIPVGFFLGGLSGFVMKRMKRRERSLLPEEQLPPLA